MGSLLEVSVLYFVACHGWMLVFALTSIFMTICTLRRIFVNFPILVKGIMYIVKGSTPAVVKIF